MKPTGYFSRENFIVDRCRGKCVLHLGCVGFTCLPADVRVRLAPRSLHHRLTAVAGKVVGVDWCEEAITACKRLGVFDNVLCGDVTRLEELPLKPEFDVIVAGDILEHLDNPGLMMKGIRRLCRPDTEVVLTAPNAFGLPNFLRYILGVFREGPDHVLTFNHWNLEHLAARAGFRVVAMHTGYEYESRMNLSPLVFHPGKWFLQWFPHLGGALIAVLKAEPEEAGRSEPVAP